MKPACPRCFAIVSYEEHGDLFAVTCPNCGVLHEGTCNRELHPRAEPGPVLTAKAVAPVSAAALKILREQVPATRNLSLDKLRSELTSDSGFWLGHLPQSRADELRDRLAPVGVWLEALQHEES